MSTDERCLDLLPIIIRKVLLPPVHIQGNENSKGKKKTKKKTLKLLNQKSSDQHLHGPLTLLIVMSFLQTEMH